MINKLITTEHKQAIKKFETNFIKDDSEHI